MGYRPGCDAVFARALSCACVCALALTVTTPAHAEDEDEREPDSPVQRVLLAPRGPLPYARLLGSVAGGAGLRFNNPYRLSTPLGGDAESVSRTAGYVDLGLAALFGSPTSFQHGPAMRLSIAVEGIGQEMLAPSYVVCRQWRSIQPCARFGVPIVLRPDLNAGAELGIGVTYFVRAGVGVVVEGVGSLFYGAGTREVAYPAYPIVSGQAGIVVSYEVLP